MLQIFNLCVLQTPTGMKLAPLIFKAIMRSITPRDGLTPERLRDFVEIMCHLPPERWADGFGEDVNFPRGRNGEGVLGFIQTQLELSRAHRAQNIAAGALLDNDTWKTLRDFTQQARQYIRSSSEGALNESMRQLEDLIHIRPSPNEANTLMNEFVEAMKEPRPNERQRWPKSFPATVQNLSDRLQAIEIVDTRPQRSWLEEVIDPESLKASLSKVATPVNKALNKLGAMSLKEVGDELLSTVSTLVTKTGYYFVFGSATELATAPEPKSPPPHPTLLSTIQEVETKASFYDEVVTTGPRYTGGFIGKLLYVANALDTVGVLSIAEKIKPHLPAVPVAAPAQPEATDTYADPHPLPNNATQPEAEANAFTAPQTREPGSATVDQTVTGPEFTSSPSSPPAPVSSSVTSGQTSLEHLTQTILDTFSKIDKCLRFPEAAANPELETLVDTVKNAFEEVGNEEPENWPPVYSSTTEPSPSWWQALVPSMQSTLAGLASYAVGAAAAATQLARDNPGATTTAAFITLSAIYDRFNQRYPNEVAGEALLPVESPALHQELIDDAVEMILDTPVAPGQPPLSDAILELMYQSTEHNLLLDKPLLSKVASLLKLHSALAPTKSYAELIHAASMETHEHEAPVQASAPDSTASGRVKRETEAVDADFVSIDSQEDGSEPLPGVGESEADKVALLDEYLKKMDELQRSAIDTGKDIDDTPMDSPDEVATKVVSLLRNRRSVTWSDSSRAAGDRELIPRYTEALLQHVNTPTNSPYIPVPTHSTFGRCWLNVIRAFNNPFFLDWAKEVGLRLETIRINPADGSLTGEANGTAYGCSLSGNSGWANVAGPIFKAIKVVNPNNERVFYPVGTRAPFSLIGAFHGESLLLNAAEARQRAQELVAAQTFPPMEAEKPGSEASVDNLNQHFGDLYTYHSLVGSLTGLIKDKSDNEILKLDSCFLSVDKDSSFASRHPTETQRMVSAQRYISDNGWIEPKNAGEVRNLIEVLTFPMPEGPEYGNYRGALDYPLPLTPAQQQIIRDTVSELGLAPGGLLSSLLAGQSVTDPAQGLGLALSDQKAKTLGERVALKLEAVSTPSSAAEWVMAALLLDLGATPGEPRNHVAGYNLTQQANWGAKPSEVIARLERHLQDGGKVDANSASVAAYHLLASKAPEFLASNIPDNLVCGSHTWASHRMAASRIEQITAGAVPKMTFEQVMNYGLTDPITVGQEIAKQMASVNPLMDWAIANGAVQQNVTDTYSAAQLQIATEKFYDLTKELAQAREYLTTPTPTREAIALAELAQVFGEGLPFKELIITRKSTPQGVSKMAYSIVDLYITGQLTPGVWKSNVPKISIRDIEQKIANLKTVNTIFPPQFNGHFDNLTTGSESIFNYLISQLPLADRINLEYGQVKYYSLREATGKPVYEQTQEMKNDLKGRHAILMSTEFKGNTTYFEVFPDALEIRKRPELTGDLKLNGVSGTMRTMNDPNRYVEVQLSTPQPFDFVAYKTGAPPRSGVTSNVIIEEIIPSTQQVTFYPPGYDYNKVPNAFAPNSRTRHIASTAVRDHFIVGREKLETLAKGSTASEDEEQLKSKVIDFFLNLVPFKSCVDNAIQGDVRNAALDCTLDAAGFLIPGAGVAGKIGSTLKSGVKLIDKVKDIAWVTSRTLVSAANPFDIFITAKNAVCTLGTGAYRAAGMGIGQLKKIYGSSKALDSAQLLKRTDLAEGVCDSAVAAGQTTKVTAMIKDGKWYAFDIARNRPYGAPLEKFRPDSAIPLERTTFSDGTSALTPSRIFDTEPHTIQRTTGVDVVVGDKVYRFDPKHPEALEDITSPTYFNAAEGFEGACSISGKSKRSSNTCFTKIVKPGGSRARRRAQAIEHKRLYPARANHGQIRKVVHERRIFTVADNGQSQKLLPSTLNKPLQYKSRTTGNIIDDKHFGLPNKQLDADLELKTRVVKIDSVVHGIDDQRDARAFLINYDHQGTGMKSYLVVESETGLYHYCDYDASNVNDIVFTKIDALYADSLGTNLIKAHDEVKDNYLDAAGTVLNNNFVTLPPLDSLYMDLVLRKGFSPEKINALKAKTALLSDEKKREFVLAVWNRGNNRNVEIALQTIKIEALSKPPGFNRRQAVDQNKFYSNGAKEKVDQELKATGLGPANQVVANSPADLQRQVLTRPVVIWEYLRAGVKTRNYADTILRTGAGNCDQMAWAAKKIIDESGGTAVIWGMPGAHTFTLVGVPRGTVTKTVDFSEPAFKDAWVVDPWAEISCPASEYITRLDLQMSLWQAQGKMIFTTDWLSLNPVQGWRSPTDPLWLAQLKNGEKMPS